MEHTILGLIKKRGEIAGQHKAAVAAAEAIKAGLVPYCPHRTGQNAAQPFQCPLRGSCSAATQGSVNVGEGP